MQTIEGIFDGKTFIPLEEIPVNTRYRVNITFVEEIDESEELRHLAAQMDSFEFWKDEREDIYQDYITRN
ncbi:MAG TPA: hypothetical protein PLR83_02840 [Pyrinomonadaceae bacterium]|nr:hypothetical protein [Pyrinomonadaceae bacterium]